MNNIITIAKRFANLPFAHRQHRHAGHCRLIHGHNWDFEFEFACSKLDDNGFVVDFGALKWLRAWLEDRFDHTLVLNLDDPHLTYLTHRLNPDFIQDCQGFAKIVVVPNCGAEGLAAWILEKVNLELQRLGIGQDRGLHVVRVTAFEDEKNSATVRLQ